MIFMGQEFLSWGYFDDNLQLDWSNAAKFPGIIQLYRELLHLRRNRFNHTRGLRGKNVNVFHVNNTDKVVAFHRWDQGGNGDDVVVILNFGSRGDTSDRIGFPRSSGWRVRFHSDWNGYDREFANWTSRTTSTDGEPQDSVFLGGRVDLGPYGAVTLSQD